APGERIPGSEHRCGVRYSSRPVERGRERVHEAGNICSNTAFGCEAGAQAKLQRPNGTAADKNQPWVVGKRSTKMATSTAQRPVLSPAVRETFDHWKQGDLFDRMEASYRQLLDRRKSVVEFPGQHEPLKHTASNCLVLQQVLLHRAERLIAACGTLILEN